MRTPHGAKNGLACRPFAEVAILNMVTELHDHNVAYVAPLPALRKEYNSSK